MKRGDLVTIAMQGDLGKPRPALVIQSDRLNETDTITVLPLSSSITDTPILRVSIQPNEKNKLGKPSQVMIDKASTIKREKVGAVFGSIGDELMLTVNRCLMVFIGIA
jgi:mRNA interferase MazF